MSGQRAILIFADDFDASDDLRAAIHFAQANPWKSNPPGVPYGSPQERYSDEETNQMIIDRLRRVAARLHVEATVIVP